jgi:hypothetical protein
MNKYLVSFVEEDDESTLNSIYYGESVGVNNDSVLIDDVPVAKSNHVVGIYQLIIGETK